MFRNLSTSLDGESWYCFQQEVIYDLPNGTVFNVLE